MVMIYQRIFLATLSHLQNVPSTLETDLHSNNNNNNQPLASQVFTLRAGGKHHSPTTIQYTKTTTRAKFSLISFTFSASTPCLPCLEINYYIIQWLLTLSNAFHTINQNQNNRFLYNVNRDRFLQILGKVRNCEIIRSLFVSFSFYWFLPVFIKIMDSVGGLPKYQSIFLLLFIIEEGALIWFNRYLMFGLHFHTILLHWEWSMWFDNFLFTTMNYWNIMILSRPPRAKSKYMQLVRTKEDIKRMKYLYPPTTFDLSLSPNYLWFFDSCVFPSTHRWPIYLCLSILPYLYPTKQCQAK